ncbi:MAG: hypothetical protein QXP88_00110 [Thermoproteota archaeon]
MSQEIVRLLERLEERLDSMEKRLDQLESSKVILDEKHTSKQETGLSKKSGFLSVIFAEEEVKSSTLAFFARESCVNFVTSYSRIESTA